MAPNLKVNLLALNDANLIDTNTLKDIPSPDVSHGMPGSDSYWDWPADVPPLSVEETQATQAAVLKKPSNVSTGTLSNIGKDPASTSECQSYWDERHFEEDIDSKFFIDYSREMGRGIQKGTVVRKAIERKTGLRFAVKTCSERKNSRADIQHEVTMLLSCGDHHPNIVKCHGTYEDSQYIHIVTEYCRGGELYDRVIERAKRSPQPPFTEPEAAFILQQILAGVNHCHACGIVHRDLKLENILMANKKNKKSGGLELTLADFGLATRMPQGGALLTERVGTNYYVAPEVLNGSGYDQSCDVWSIGVIAYTLFCAKPPFRGVTEVETFDLIQNQEVQFNDDAWKSVSDQAKGFITACLQKDPQHRPSAQYQLNDKWIQQQTALLKKPESGGKKNKRMLQRFKKALHLP